MVFAFPRFVASNFSDMKAQILESEHFGSAQRTYFLDYAKAANDSNYIRFTRSDKQADGSYRRNTVVVFEHDFTFLIESFSMLFTSMIHREEKSEGTSDGKTGAGSSPQFRTRGIKSWAPEARPREKFMAGGAAEVSDAELLAMLIGSGTRRETAVDLADQILKANGGSLRDLSGMTHRKLARFPGIGPAKASSILAAIELGKRMALPLPLPFKLKAV